LKEERSLTSTSSAQVLRLRSAQVAE